MHTKLVYLLLLVAICSCKSKTDKIADDDTLWYTGMGDTAMIQPDDSAGVNVELSNIWIIDYDARTKKKNPRFTETNLQPDSLIKVLNQTYPEIPMQKIKLSGDTLFTRIPESEYLTERIGSYGASMYVADAVINLTSVPGINFVNIQFKDGSHLSSGTWAKTMFANYSEVK